MVINNLIQFEQKQMDMFYALYYKVYSRDELQYGELGKMVLFGLIL